MTIPTIKPQTWSRDGFIITTDEATILQSRSSLNAALASEHLYWSVGMTDEELITTIKNSVCFGVYSPTSSSLPAAEPVEGDEKLTGPQSPAEVLHEVAERVHRPSLETRESESPALIGLARLVTDRVTMAYLTDVYIHPDWEKRGLGTWLMRCVREWTDQIPKLRRVILITSEGQKESFYAKMLETGRMEEEGSGSRVFVSRARH